MKKLVLLVALVALLAVIAACAPAPTPAPTAAPPTAAPASSSAAPASSSAAPASSSASSAAAATGAIKGTLTLWHGYHTGGSEEVALNQLLDGIKKANPDLKLTVLAVPFDQLFNKYETESAAGGGPDLWTAPNDNLGNEVRANLLYPLDAKLQGKLDKYSKLSVDGVTVEGHIYAVPMIVKAVALYYNKSKIPNPPKTTDDLLALLKSGKTIALNESNYHNYGFFPAFGGTLMDPKGACIADQTTGFADAMQYLLNLKAAGAKFESDGGKADTEFRQGQVDMIINGPWVLGDYKGDLKDNLGVVPMPTGPKGPSLPLSGIDGWYVNANSKNVDAAVALGLALTTPDAQKVYADLAGDPPVRTDVSVADPLVKAFADAGAAGYPRPQSAAFGNWWGPFGDMVTKVIEGKATPKDGVAQACSDMNKANKITVAPAASSASSASSAASSAASSSSSSAAPAATNTPAPTATPPVPKVTAAPGALKLQFWHVFSTSQGVAMQNLLDKFNAANPQYYIVGTYQGSYTPISQKMTASITANSLPDIIWGYPGDIANYYNAGVVVPFDSYINDPKDGLTAAQLADINTSVYFSKYDNKTIAISAAGSEQVMFYNADMLKAAGFTQPPATWADFDKVCAAVSKPPDTYCYAFIPSASTVAEWFWSWGSDYASADEKTAAFNNPNGLAMLQWLKNQADKKWAYQPSGSFGDQTDFGNGKVAFTFSSTAGLPFYASAVSGSKAPFNWSIAPVPGGPNGKQVVDVFQPSMAILKSTADKQRAAWLWVKFMLSKDGGTDWALATTYYPPAKSTLDALTSMDAATAKTLNPSFATVLDQYKLGTKFAASGGRVEPASPAWQGVRTIVENMVTAIFTGKSGADFKATDPQGALTEGAQRVNDALSQYGK